GAAARLARAAARSGGADPHPARAAAARRRPPHPRRAGRADTPDRPLARRPPRRAAAGALPPPPRLGADRPPRAGRPARPPPRRRPRPLDLVLLRRGGARVPLWSGDEAVMKG